MMEDGMHYCRLIGAESSRIIGEPKVDDHEIF